MDDGFATQHTTGPKTAECGTADPATAERGPAESGAAEPEADARATAEPDTTTNPEAVLGDPNVDIAIDVLGVDVPARGFVTLADSTTQDTKMREVCAEPNIPTTLGVPDIEADGRAGGQRASTRSYLPRFTRRAVVERDGLCCSWVDEQGARCGSRAWLEYDHCHSRAKGGGSEPNNLRLLCRHHNQFAAEREYGRRHVEEAIFERRRKRAPYAPPAI